MDDPIFALLDDIAESARGGGGEHVTNSLSFSDQQLLDEEPRYLVEQRQRQQQNNPKRGHGGGEVVSDLRQVQGSRHFQNHAPQAVAGLPRLAVSPNSFRQAENLDTRPLQSQVYRTRDECMSGEPAQPRPAHVNLSQHSFNGPPSQGVSSPPASGLPSSPALRASQRRHDHRAHQSRPTQFGYEESAGLSADDDGADSRFQLTHHSADQEAITLPHAPRLVQGIQLRSTHELPDRFRSIFSFPNFNAVQSKCFDSLYRTNDNFVLSSPTGSGKTVAFELAICRLINRFSGGDFKIVYQAPTKSLCSERQRDWSQKFRPFDLVCAELTGDTDLSQMKNVQNASVIITTPEKWDSMTRKWKDHIKLMKMIKLFLIDEVHMLKEERGAVLEVVVSRMKSIGSDVRFIALSASIPNSNDIATWLGKNPVRPQDPATREVFGEEFRPVKLVRHVVGYSSSSNDFAFEKALDARLPEVISKYSHKKPIMVFCATRKSVEATAQMLANWWSTKPPQGRYWEASRKPVAVENRVLRGCISSAVGFHHAGLGQEDRLAVEKAFLNADINVICCTSTLAVGVNLPCHFVVIKNTCAYTNEGMKEYSDLEIMQMLGRAGRPQFDNTAVAVIMTRQEKVKKYEKMVSGREILESCLHRNLIDHLNAEIVLGTVTNLSSAKKWLSGTFLYVRLREHPEHYRIDGDDSASRLEERLERIASRDVDLLRKGNFVRGDSPNSEISSTEFGEAMARYCVHFETAQHFLSLPPKAKQSEMLSALAQAKEFKEIRFRGNEKSCYKQLNKTSSIKFMIPVNLDTPAHKVSLVIQSQLGGVDLPTDEKTTAAKFQYITDVNIIFQHISRLIRCIVDFSLYKEDSVALRNSLALCRSLGARCWDDSPLQMKQLERVGIFGVRKLVNAGIKSIEELEHTEAHRIETILKRAQPFGLQVVDSARSFPKPRVSVQMMGNPIVRSNQGVTINVKAEIGFVNEKLPVIFQRRAVYVVFLAETTDGRKIEFRRISARKLDRGTEIKFSVTLTDPTQAVACHVMCDELAGTLRSATLSPKLPRGIHWPKPKPQEPPVLSIHRPDPNSARCRGETPHRVGHGNRRASRDEFGDDDLDDQDLLAAMADGFEDEFKHIDDYDNDSHSNANQSVEQPSRMGSTSQFQTEWEPTKMENGKWSCNHRCKDRSACRHICCREGLDKPPKAPKSLSGADKHNAPASTQQKKTLPTGQTTLNLNKAAKSKVLLAAASTGLAQVDLTQEPKKATARVPSGLERLERLHSKTLNSRETSAPNAGASSHVPHSTHRLSFAPKNDRTELRDLTSDYGDSWPDSDLPDLDIITQRARPCNGPNVPTKSSAHRLDPYAPIGELDDFEDSDSLMNDVMIGLADSQELQRERDLARAPQSDEDVMTALEETLEETSATVMSDTPKAALRASKQTLYPSEVSMKAFPNPVQKRPRVCPFIDTSSDSRLFATPGSTLLPKAAEFIEDDDVDFGEPFTKRIKTMGVANKENETEVDPTPLTDPDIGNRGTEVEDGKARREDIDNWFMQEFGDYVEFT